MIYSARRNASIPKGCIYDLLMTYSATTQNSRQKQFSNSTKYDIVNLFLLPSLEIHLEEFVVYTRSISISNPLSNPVRPCVCYLPLHGGLLRFLRWAWEWRPRPGWCPGGWRRRASSPPMSCGGGAGGGSQARPPTTPSTPTGSTRSLKGQMLIL